MIASIRKWFRQKLGLAKVLYVGPGSEFTSFHDAIRAAKPGDVVVILPVNQEVIG